MIKFLYANIAFMTVNSSWRSINKAVIAKACCYIV